MRPPVRQRRRIERRDQTLHVGELEQTRSPGNQQANRELNRRDVLDQIQLLDRVQQLDVVVERHPRMERDEGWRERHANLAAQRHGLDEIAPGVSFVEPRQHAVVDRLRGARDEQAPGVAQPRQQIAMTQQVFDLDGHVVGHVGMRGVESVDHAGRVRRTVEEIRIAEGDVAGAGGHLARNVGQHDVGLHDAELPCVHRHDGTVPAQMPAASARFGVADQGAPAVSVLQHRVAIGRRQPAPIGNEEFQTRDRIRCRADL